MRPVVAVVALASLLSLVSARPARAAAEDDVRATFDRYKQAVQARKGAAAVREVDQGSVRYFAKIRSTALSAPDIRALAPADKIMVLRVRLELPPQLLTEMDAEKLIAYAIDKGWVSPEQVAASVLGKIKIAGNRAEGHLVLLGQEVPAPFIFRKEQGAWKVDLTAFNASMNSELKSAAKKQKVSEDELAMRLIRQIAGRPVPEKIWEPIAAKPGR